MKGRKGKEPLPTAFAFAVAALGASTAYLFAVMAGKLILGALVFLVLFRMVKDRRFPDFSFSNGSARKKRKGGKIQWFPY